MQFFHIFGRKMVSVLAEQVIYSHPCLVVLLKLLFHMMLLHGYVPDVFATGIIVTLNKR